MVKERRCERDAGATGGEAGENAGGRAGEGRGGFQAWGGARRVGSVGAFISPGESRNVTTLTKRGLRVELWIGHVTPPICRRSLRLILLVAAIVHFSGASLGSSLLEPDSYLINCVLRGFMTMRLRSSERGFWGVEAFTNTLWPRIECGGMPRKTSRPKRAVPSPPLA